MRSTRRLVIAWYYREISDVKLSDSKHPALAGKQQLVRNCLREPEVIRASSKDPDVHLFYRREERGYLCVVVGGEDPMKRFVVTAYFTREIKRGQELWIG